MPVLCLRRGFRDSPIDNPIAETTCTVDLAKVDGSTVFEFLLMRQQLFCHNTDPNLKSSVTTATPGVAWYTLERYDRRSTTLVLKISMLKAPVPKQY